VRPRPRRLEMPVHDQGYRLYAGERTGRDRRWLVIARAGTVERFRERRFLAPSDETFHSFLNQQRLLVFFITIYAGAGLIASDRQANALQLYLSKPIA